jgi:hypothetical protein
MIIVVLLHAVYYNTPVFWCSVLTVFVGEKSRRKSTAAQRQQRVSELNHKEFQISLLGEICERLTDILQYRLRFGFSLLYKTAFHLNSLTAQLSYEGRAAVEGAK